MIICCDIDGVLADARPFLYKYLPHDWKTYFTHTEEFDFIEPTRSLLSALKDDPSLQLYFVTGRPESNKLPTVRWLINFLGYNPMEHLLMRANGDMRSGTDIKLEWFRKIKPDLVIDDSPETVEAAVKEGFVVLQVHGFRATPNDMVPENYSGEKRNDRS